MTETLIPDTHSLLWFLTQDSRLSDPARLALREAVAGDTLIVVPIIVLVEALRLVEKRKTPLTMDELIDQLSSRENIRMRPLDLEVFAAMRELHPGMEMHDRIIAATARLYEATVITKDPAFEGVVETLW